MMRVLVFGATGQQGGAVVDALLSLKNPPQIRALARKLDAPAALTLAKKGVELVPGSYTDQPSLVKALQGCDAAFLVTTPFPNVEAEITSGKAQVDAAKTAGVGFVVYSSVGSSDEKTGVPHFDSKWDIEQYLASSGLKHTILRPVAFMDNFPKQKGVGSAMAMGLFEATLNGKKLQTVAVSDIAWFAAQVFSSPEAYAGRTIALAGDELSMSETAAVYSRVSGQTAWKAWIPGFVIRLLPFDFRRMMQFFARTGYSVDIGAVRKEHPALLTFEEWLRKE